MSKAFASHIFSTKNIGVYILDINIWNFNETLTNNIVCFEQPGPDMHGRLISEAS